eukprot:Gregarina_sp_Pseudo_9__679@NODE_1431_length_1610_cov_24_823679_g1329_i0_p1_GENE_NODE_1431_length_1610_cov_24_823679_g1329_i0NODE_1431_length_1610_cov_24_823679_g1329_i0_p1_ORF_typecomplete_len347_score74_89_NODE_1431_length_1610_cov_24_823679_g1329_i05261566
MISLKEALEFTKEIPSFSPSFSVHEAEQWFDFMDAEMDKYGIPNDLRLHVLLPKLDPEGQSLVYRSGLHDWNAAKCLLRRRPQGSARPLLPLDYLDVSSMHMDCLETPAEFASRLRQVVSQAQKERGFEFPEALLVQCFVYGICNKHLRHHLKQQNVTTLDEAITCSNLWTASHPTEAASLPPQTRRRSSTSQSSGVSRAGLSLIDRAKYAIDPKVLDEVLSMMKTMRLRQTVQDVRRLKLLCRPDLTPEERKNILETPDEDDARFRLHFETDIPFIFGMRFRVTRPWATWVMHAPRLGRWFSKRTKGKPIITPGKWLAKILRWDIPTKTEQREEEALDRITAAVD